MLVDITLQAHHHTLHMVIHNRDTLRQEATHLRATLPLVATHLRATLPQEDTHQQVIFLLAATLPLAATLLLVLTLQLVTLAHLLHIIQGMDLEWGHC